jgi:hypothetical protein
MQWRYTNIVAHMHVSSVGNESINDVEVANTGRAVQGRYTQIVARTHVSSTGNERIDYV